ncbi:GBP2, partial [Symbiodinium sp. CCMP2456]
ASAVPHRRRAADVLMTCPASCLGRGDRGSCSSWLLLEHRAKQRATWNCPRHFDRRWWRNPRILALFLLQCRAFEFWYPFNQEEAVGAVSECEDSRCTESTTSTTPASVSSKVDFRAVPLVVPQNAYADEDGCWRIPAGGRGDLQLHPDGVAVLMSSGCEGGWATVSWNGHARCGKSFMASECTTLDESVDRNFEAHFTLGHSMDSCSKGIFVSARPLRHPKMPDVCILQMDAEGLNAFGRESTLQSDADLALFTYLTSSVWTFSSKGAFDAHSLDLLQIVTRLAENIDVGEKLVHGPALHWLLQAVHLQPTLNGRSVSVQDYFDSMLRSYDDPLKIKGREDKDAARRKNEVRETLRRNFEELKVTAFPPLTGDEQLLRKLPEVPRNGAGVNPDFVQTLDLFKASLLATAKPKKLQRDHKMITAQGPILVAFMNKTLEYINIHKPMPVFNVVDDLINRQIDDARKATVAGWRDCMHSQLAAQKKKHKQQRMEKLRSLAEVEQVGLPYWSPHLRSNVSGYIREAQVPHESSSVSFWHPGCYRTSLARALEPLNEESHNVQEQLVARVEKQLGVGRHADATSSEFATLQEANRVTADTYNLMLLEYLWDAHLSHLRKSFHSVTAEDFKVMMKVVESAYGSLSAGPGSSELFFSQKTKFMMQAEAFVSFGETLRQMEQQHDEKLKAVMDRIDTYKSELSRLQSEFDSINAERGRLQREMDLQRDQYESTVSVLQQRLEATQEASASLNQSQWQLREQMAARQKEYEEELSNTQAQYDKRLQQQEQEQKRLASQVQGKDSELKNLEQRMEEAATANVQLRAALRHLQEQECGTRTVLACTGRNYEGNCQPLRVSFWSHCSLINAGLPDNSIKSARIPPGCHFAVWSGQGHTGAEATFTEDVPDINLSGGVSSARVY